MSMSPKQKVYQGVLQEIRKLIDDHKLKTGDKLPSERELSEKLKAGRSSVREALRAMELLGLIETRHGEGTFLSAYKPFQTVEVLASFILQDNSTRSGLLSTKQILEKEAAKLAFGRINKDHINELINIIDDNSMDITKQHRLFFSYIFEKTENLLLSKIWWLMEEYSHTMNKVHYPKNFYRNLTDLYNKKDYQSIELLFKDFAILN
ncbi:GntR family transcriptional regulator [Ornithinibacillus sp. L9]|uniref:GntR family transcriptional regulator n=1 Tax=Ornithinibacillus caprae TaxID=2678566 RepID=A0A6N8FGL1_9BACI|nr:GntR family transcriptional regulator [Ornithinibacillus caprae]